MKVKGEIHHDNQTHSYGPEYWCEGKARNYKGFVWIYDDFRSSLS